MTGRILGSRGLELATLAICVAVGCGRPPLLDISTGSGGATPTSGAAAAGVIAGDGGDGGSFATAGRGGAGEGGSSAGAGGSAAGAGAGAAATGGGAQGGAGPAGAGGGAKGGAGAAGAGGGAGAGGPRASANLAINAAHDGTQPDEAVATPLAKRWSVNLGGPVSYPLIADGRLFLSYADGAPKIAAYDLNAGTIAWGPFTISSTVWLAYDGGNLFALDQNGLLSGWDAKTGRALWKTILPKQWLFEAPPVAAGGVVYANGLGSGGTIYAVVGATGAMKWTTDYYGGDGPVAIGDGVIYQVGACQLVSTMNVATGALKVIHSTSCMGGGGAMPVYSDRRLWVADNIMGNIIVDTFGMVVGTFSSWLPAVHAGTAFGINSPQITAVDVATGKTKWSAVIAGVCTTPIVAGRGGQVFVGTVGGVLYELDEVSGKAISKHDTGLGSDFTCWPMALAEGRLAYATGYGVVVY